MEQEKAVQVELPIHRELRILEDKVTTCRESMSELQRRLEPIISQPQPTEATKTPTPESNSPLEGIILGIQSRIEEVTEWINNAIQRLQI